MVFKYDKGADVLSIEISKKSIDYAQEMGDFVVHFNKKDKPVLLEVLNAKRFLKKSFKLLPKKVQKRTFSYG